MPNQKATLMFGLFRLQLETTVITARQKHRRISLSVNLTLSAAIVPTHFYRYITFNFRPMCNYIVTPLGWWNDTTVLQTSHDHCDDFQ